MDFQILLSANKKILLEKEQKLTGRGLSSLTNMGQCIKLGPLLIARGQRLRIGQGFDVHRFAEGRKLILGGVELDYPLGLEGHSDADVVIHAVIDALLGAAGLGDIGMHFPDSDPAYKGMSSLKMLETICTAIQELGFRIGNIDVTVIAQEPRIAPYRPEMVGNLAGTAGIESERVNVKATSTEGLGFPGRKEGIAALAVVYLQDPRSA